MKPILIANGISKTFGGIYALDNVTLQINAGEIHCIVGENGCGKSTLMKCVSGVYVPDAGTITLNGITRQKLTPEQAIRDGVQVIYQDLSLFPYMTIAENIAIEKLNALGKKFIDWKEVYQVAKEQIDKIKVEMDLSRRISESSVSTKQLTAICRALAHDAKLLIMDEPTTALTKKEVSQLLSIVQNLKKTGMAIIFISHKLDEVFSIADKITVIRNGKLVGDYQMHALSEKKLSQLMTGREVEYPRYHRVQTDSEKIFEVKGLTKKNQYNDISFSLRRGDIVGMIGLLGSGRTEIALSLFGLNPIDNGDILIKEKSVQIGSPSDAKLNGIALLPEDRFIQGLHIERAIKENTSAAILDDLSKNLFLDYSKEFSIARNCVEKLNVRAQSVDSVVRSLSGGNQQKVAIGKWIETYPDVFIMDSPTVGIDIGSKAEIYEKIHGLANNGMAFLILSDDIDEILANCNRVLIMEQGSIQKVLDEQDLADPDVAKTILDSIGNTGKAILHE